MPSSQPKEPLIVRNARVALLREYGDLVPSDDLPAAPNADRENRLVSRALAAIALRSITGFSAAESGRLVIDGDLDYGIDALAVDLNSSRITIVQAKWSNTGTATLDKAAALKLVEGIRLLDERRFNRFNHRLQPIIPRLDNALSDPALEIELVIALMGEGSLSTGATQVLDDVCASYNVFAPMLSYRAFTATDVINQLRNDSKPPVITISAYLDQWLHLTGPRPQYMGWVAGNEAAGWFAEHGTQLFGSNLRSGLGRTDVNDGIIRTLFETPEEFSQRNNGLTILCSAADPTFHGSRQQSQREAVTLKLTNASIINGAQTLSSVHEAWSTKPDLVSIANIPVTIIVMRDNDHEHAAAITASRNTQNHVIPRDLRALDPCHGRLWEDFNTYLQKTYTYKRGEPAPAPEAGCSLDEAAIALASAHRHAELAVRAKANKNTLWEVGKSGAYPLLFGGEPSAPQVWNIVILHRAIAAALAQKRAKLTPRASEIADRADQLIVHIVFRLLELDFESEDLDLAEATKQARQTTDVALRWFLHHLDVEFGAHSYLSPVLNNEANCLRITAYAIASARQGSSTPTIEKKYLKARGPRRPNTVPMLVTNEAIPSGAELLFLSPSTAEQSALAQWLNEDLRRSRSTWIQDRAKCLLWAYDGERYSPTGLVDKIWELAGWENRPVAVQGPARWLYGAKTLATIAEDLWRDQQS